MRGVRHFRTLEDLASDELIALLDRADQLAAQRGRHARPLEGKSVVILLEKASTRTRLSFEVGVAELGGNPITLIARDTQLGRGEPPGDTARMLSGYAHGVVYRTFDHAAFEAFCQVAQIPVINGLTDTYHPCQLLADLQTVRAELGTLDVEVAWIGDGNNMAHSWILAAARTGLRLRIASPEGYAVDDAVLARGRELGAQIEIFDEADDAVKDAHVVTTDVWASMGQEAESEARARAFAGFQVDARRMEMAHQHAIFLHCLPAHRGEEVSADVIDGPWSRVWREAENRLHAQKALLELLV